MHQNFQDCSMWALTSLAFTRPCFNTHFGLSFFFHIYLKFRLDVWTLFAWFSIGSSVLFFNIFHKVFHFLLAQNGTRKRCKRHPKAIPNRAKIKLRGKAIWGPFLASTKTARKCTRRGYTARVTSASPCKHFRYYRRPSSVAVCGNQCSQLTSNEFSQAAVHHTTSQAAHPKLRFPSTRPGPLPWQIVWTFLVAH